MAGSDHVKFLQNRADGLGLIIVLADHFPEEQLHFLSIDLSIMVDVESLDELFDFDWVGPSIFAQCSQGVEEERLQLRDGELAVVVCVIDTEDLFDSFLYEIG